LTPKGIVIDSVLTIAQNKMIYGKFYDYSYNETVEINAKEIKKWNREIKRIKELKNSTN
jgi:hypothetical protein